MCAFKGWNDAGEAASAAVQFLCEAFDAQTLATIDPQEYYDFTAVRPTVRLVEGRSRAIDWPENSFNAARVRGADRDLIILRGVEPSLRWKSFCADVMEVANSTGARMMVTLGALLADVPHSRPVGITGRLTSTLPAGAGLSSSAALEVCVALALCDVAEFPLGGMELDAL